MNFFSGSGRETMGPLMSTGDIDVLAFIGGAWYHVMWCDVMMSVEMWWGWWWEVAVSMCQLHKMNYKLVHTEISWTSWYLSTSIVWFRCLIAHTLHASIHSFMTFYLNVLSIHPWHAILLCYPSIYPSMTWHGTIRQPGRGLDHQSTPQPSQVGR